MKEVALLTLAMSLIIVCKAQEFVFQMKFEDSMGNVDSLMLGYDYAASDSLDAAFGETNIISTIYKDGLDVRAGNQFFIQANYPGAGLIPFETKTQIVPDICGTDSFWLLLPIIEIHLVSTHFPIKASWNKTLFDDTCRNGSVFTSVHWGGWWDTGGFREELSAKDSATFDENQYGYFSGTDFVNVYWLAFSDSGLLALALNEVSTNDPFIKVFPNPSSDFITLTAGTGFLEKEQIEFYNALGQFVLLSNQWSELDISGLPDGLYFIKIKNGKGGTAISKFQKM